MIKLVRAYFRGVRMMGRPTWAALLDEIHEFREKPSCEEAWDMLHVSLRFVGLGILAWPTVRKHGVRVLTRGCPRSERNCIAAGDSCCCME